MVHHNKRPHLTHDPAVIRLEHITRGTQSSVVRLHRRHESVGEAPIILKYNKNHNSATIEKKVYRSLKSKGVVPRYESCYECTHCVTIKDAGFILSSYRIGGPCVENVSLQEYEEVFLSKLLPDSFKKRKILIQKIAPKLLADIKPSNLLKKKWEEEDLKFIDFEENMITWGFAAPELINGHFTTYCTLWSLALSLLSLVMRFKTDVLSPEILKSENDPRVKYERLIEHWKIHQVLQLDNSRLDIEKIGQWRAQFSDSFKTSVKDFLRLSFHQTGFSSSTKGFMRKKS